VVERFQLYLTSIPKTSVGLRELTGYLYFLKSHDFSNNCRYTTTTGRSIESWIVSTIQMNALHPDKILYDSHSEGNDIIKTLYSVRKLYDDLEICLIG
jgi:hypothetical protein